jgi:hypothetical protein
MIAKTKRLRDRATGIKKAKRPFRQWRKFDGTIVRNPNA